MRHPLLWIICCTALLPAPAPAAPVTFRVNMGPYLAAGYFDPSSDLVEVRGDFDGWAAGQRVLQAGVGQGTYSVVADLPSGAIAYKFLIVRSGGAEVWEEDIPNRTWQVPAGGGAAPTVPFDDLSDLAAPDARRVGADLSYAPRLEAHGATYRRDGQPAPLLGLAGDAGFGLVRLRLWHAPDEPWHGLEATLDHARRVRAAGFDLMLDLHYSDSWADPGQQTLPAAWQGVALPALADSLAAYTARIVARFTDEGLALRYVQLGNEIDAGLLWDAGRVGWPGGPWDTPAQWGALTSLLQAAAGAARAALPPDTGTELIVHLSPGGDNARCRWFLDHLAAAAVDYDVIGLSYYPWWHGSLWQLESNLRDLGPRYGKKVMVVETAYPWTLAAADDTGNFVDGPEDLVTGYPATPQGQLDFLRDVRRIVETSGGVGTVYWEPAFIPTTGGPENPWENLALFDFDGNALPGLGFGDAADGATPAPALPRTGLLQNHPNPFNPGTLIRYHVERAGPIDLSVYDLAGRRVCTLAGDAAAAGWHQVSWTGRDGQGRDVPSGLYFYALETPQGAARRRMTLLR